jgi:hypothetical protein
MSASRRTTSSHRRWPKIPSSRRAPAARSCARKRAAGRQLWRVKAGMDLTAGVGTDGNVIAVGGAKGMLLAFDMDGKPLWKAQLSSEILSAPAVGQGIVVARSIDNRIVGYDAKTGDKKWTVQRTAPPLTLRLAPGLIVHDKDVIIAQPGGKILSLILATGAPRWEIEVGVAKGATELERVTDIGGYAGHHRRRPVRRHLPGPRRLLRPGHRQRALDPRDVVGSRRHRRPALRLRPGRQGRLFALATATPAPAPGRTTSWPSAACPRRSPTAAPSRSATTRAMCISCRAKKGPSWPARPPMAAPSRRRRWLRGRT